MMITPFGPPFLNLGDQPRLLQSGVDRRGKRSGSKGNRKDQCPHCRVTPDKNGVCHNRACPGPKERSRW